MRYAPGFALLLLLALAAPAAAEEGGVEKSPIDWRHDLDAARAEANEAGKPLVLYFTFDT